MDKFERAPQMLTPDEVAARMSVHAETVRRWIRGGQLPASKIGRLLRVDARDLALFAAQTNTQHSAHTQNDSNGTASGQGQAQ